MKISNSKSIIACIKVNKISINFEFKSHDKMHATSVDKFMYELGLCN